MKIPRTAIHLVIGVEAVVLILVLVISILNPVKDAVTKNDFKDNSQNRAEDSTEKETELSTEDDVVSTITFSDAVISKVAGMSLEQKVAQMFVTTPEQLTGMGRVTVTGNTTKNAISAIPVGGLVYSVLNFEGAAQTASMTKTLQTYYKEQFGMPLFLMLAEAGGAEGSPLASENRFEVEKSPAEIGVQNDVALAASAATNIAAYMTNQGLNTNTGITGGYSDDSEVEAGMLDATILAYKEAGLYTATTEYHGAADIILLGDAQPFSDMVHALRYEKQYQGILFADTFTDTQSVIDAIHAGADMVYCDTDLKATYQAVVDAVNQGTINEELVNEAVMRILTYKGYE